MSATATMKPKSRFNDTYTMNPSEWKRIAKRKLCEFSNFCGNAKDCLKAKLRHCVANFQKSFTRNGASEETADMTNVIPNQHRQYNEHMGKQDDGEIKQPIIEREA